MGEVIPFPKPCPAPKPTDEERYGDTWISIGEAARRVVERIRRTSMGDAK